MLIRDYWYLIKLYNYINLGLPIILKIMDQLILWRPCDSEMSICERGCYCACYICCFMKKKNGKENS